MIELHLIKKTLKVAFDVNCNFFVQHSLDQVQSYISLSGLTFHFWHFIVTSMQQVPGLSLGSVLSSLLSVPYFYFSSNLNNFCTEKLLPCSLFL